MSNSNRLRHNKEGDDASVQLKLYLRSWVHSLPRLLITLLVFAFCLAVCVANPEVFAWLRGPIPIDQVDFANAAGVYVSVPYPVLPVHYAYRSTFSAEEGMTPSDSYILVTPSVILSATFSGSDGRNHAEAITADFPAIREAQLSGSASPQRLTGILTPLSAGQLIRFSQATVDPAFTLEYPGRSIHPLTLLADTYTLSGTGPFWVTAATTLLALLAGLAAAILLISEALRCLLGTYQRPLRRYLQKTDNPQAIHALYQRYREAHKTGPLWIQDGLALCFAPKGCFVVPTESLNWVYSPTRAVSRNPFSRKRRCLTLCTEGGDRYHIPLPFFRQNTQLIPMQLAIEATKPGIITGYSRQREALYRQNPALFADAVHQTSL